MGICTTILHRFLHYQEFRSLQTYFSAISTSLSRSYMDATLPSTAAWQRETAAISRANISTHRHSYRESGKTNRHVAASLPVPLSCLSVFLRLPPCTVSLYPCNLPPSLSRSLSDLSLTPPRVGGSPAAESARAPDSALLLENSEVFSRVLLVMGVPAFFRWLSRKYPSIVVHCVEEKVRPIVNLAKIA